MHGNMEFKQQGNNSTLQTISMTVRDQAYSCQSDSLALLTLLRLLESLHQDIRDSLFIDSLPNDRQALYALLQNIEEECGWPLIPRMKLRSLLANLPENIPNQVEPDEAHTLISENSELQFSLITQGEIA